MDQALTIVITIATKMLMKAMIYKNFDGHELFRTQTKAIYDPLLK